MTADPLFERLARALAGRYRLERELGRGGMGTVFLATDVKLGRSVAIKVLPPNTREYLGDERFQREVRLVAALSHPHIVPLFETDEADGCLYYVMEYIEGETLADRLEREGPLPLDEALRIVAEIGDALQYAHERGLVHRDVKPPNILLARGHALLADFGIAKETDAGAERLTGTGVGIGTAEYMSPEQASGERRVDARSDVYALGAVLFEMLVGEPPFTGPNVQAIVARIMAAAPQSIRTVRPTIPPHVEDAVLAALAKTPADRPSSARAFVDRLVRPTGERQARVPVRRWAVGAGAIALAVVVVLIATRGGRGTSPVGMALVPSGTFRLFGGDCPRCLPARDVRLDSFYIDRTEVPVVAYARYVAAGNAPAPWTVRPADSLPATGILWAEAAGYCRWRDPRARLPTEEEWEAAARGPRGELYPWGAVWESGRANADNVRAGLTPVGAFPSGATAAGVLDLIGNAWEWTASPAQSQYIIRGGALNSPGTVATGLYRTSLPGAVPESLRLASYGNTGFRCVRAVRAPRPLAGSAPRP